MMIWAKKITTFSGKVFSSELPKLFFFHKMGLVRITSWYPNFNGSHFGLPPSEIHRMTGLPPKIVWTMTYSHRPHWVQTFADRFFNCPVPGFLISTILNIFVSDYCYLFKHQTAWRWQERFPLKGHEKNGKLEKSSKKKKLMRKTSTFLLRPDRSLSSFHLWCNTCFQGEVIKGKIFRLITNYREIITD